ncbi:5-oxoprolinase subunit PxpB [Flavobacteriaceae bacterium MHTCC 0001]
MKFKLNYKPFSEHAILIEWPQQIDEAILYDILNFKAYLQKEIELKIKSMYHAYASLLIVYNIEGFNYDENIIALAQLYSKKKKGQKVSKTLWKIPVCYDTSFGVDLEEFAKEKQCSITDIVSKHKAPIYTVYFNGFLPGFMYLGGLDASLFTPRKASPRLKIEKGAVAIGGQQTGIYPSESPGGWQIIGNSPINFFDVSNTVPCFTKAGDLIQFFEISLKEYTNTKHLVEAGVYQIQNQVIK